MNEREQNRSGNGSRTGLVQGERLVYVMPDESTQHDDIDLTQLWQTLWWGRWIIVGTVVVSAIASVLYALSVTHWYRSEALLAPAEERTATQGLAAQFGGLAGLVGINVSGGDTTEALAVLRSRDFTRAFIEEQDLLPVLFADRWDAATGQWIDDESSEPPDMRQAVQFFNENIRQIDEDERTGLITLAVEWTDPELAAQWAGLLVQRVNENMRERALRDAERNVSYLRSELERTNVVPLQESIGRLLEVELQKVLLARGNDEFAFRVIDRPEVPVIPSRPSRRLIVIVSVMAGGIASLALVFLSHFVYTKVGRKT